MQSNSSTQGPSAAEQGSESRVAFETFYTEHLDNMVRLATFLLCSQTQAEEIVQEAFLVVHRRWSELHTPGGFLRTAVVNRCKDAMRHRAVKVKKLGTLRRAAEVQQRDDLAESHAASDYFLRLLQQLKPRRRTVIVLKFYGGHTMREIAELLSIPEGTVRSDVRRGIEQLRGLTDEF